MARERGLYITELRETPANEGTAKYTVGKPPFRPGSPENWRGICDAIKQTTQNGVRGYMVYCSDPERSIFYPASTVSPVFHFPDSEEVNPS